MYIRSTVHSVNTHTHTCMYAYQECVHSFAMRGHDILYSDWGRRYSTDLYIALNLLFVYCAQVIFIMLIIVVLIIIIFNKFS